MIFHMIFVPIYSRKVRNIITSYATGGKTRNEEKVEDV